MSYILTDDKGRYIGKNGVIVSSEEEAFRWESEIKATKYLKSCLSKSARGFSFKVRDVTVAEDFQESYKEELYNLEDIENFKSCLKNLFATRVNKSRVKFLTDNIQKLDLEVVDIQHAIEFNKVDAVNGYKMFQDVLVQRRLYKNELQKINIIQNIISEDKELKLVRSLDSVDDKKYQPRVLKELFK